MVGKVGFAVLATVDLVAVEVCVICETHCDCDGSSGRDG
jgi:hypothetical protein